MEKKRESNLDPIHLNHSNPHMRLTHDLFPKYPNPLTSTHSWGDLEPTPLNYNGWSIMGVYSEGTGVGFGRVMPYEAIHHIKLLKYGFEYFPFWKKKWKPFKGYIFLVTNGAEEIISFGKKIADGSVFETKAFAVEIGK